MKKAEDSLFLAHGKYALANIRRVGMKSCKLSPIRLLISGKLAAHVMSCKPAPTPLFVFLKVCAHDGDLLNPEDRTRYRSVVDALSI